MTASRRSAGAAGAAGIPRDTPGLFVIGFDNINGPGAGTIGGVGPFARDIARRITGRRQ